MSSYFNKIADEDADDDDDSAPWNDLKSNDWGDTQEIAEETWKEMAPATPVIAPAVVKAPVNTASWSQEKPAASQGKNDWDSDAFFDNVLTSSSKPKLKGTRR